MAPMLGAFASVPASLWHLFDRRLWPVVPNHNHAQLKKTRL